MAKTTLGEYIRNLRNKKDMGVRELGRAVKVSGVHISSIEKNKATPSPELLNKIALIPIYRPILVCKRITTWGIQPIKSK